MAEDFSGLVMKIRIERFEDVDARYEAARGLEAGYLQSAGEKVQGGLRNFYKSTLEELERGSQGIMQLKESGALKEDYTSVLQMNARRIELLKRLIAHLDAESSD